MCGIIELGQSTTPTRTAKIDQDSFEHIVTCVRILADPSATAVLGSSYGALCRASFQKLIAVRSLGSSVFAVLLAALLACCLHSHHLHGVR